MKSNKRRNKFVAFYLITTDERINYHEPVNLSFRYPKQTST